jgi:hypothetical protein
VHSEIFAVNITQRESYRLRKAAAPVGSRINMSDKQLLDRARRAKNGEKFIRLYDEGDISGYPSQSEADQALCYGLAFWSGCDAATIDRLFRESELMRPKWDEQRGAMTYGELTVKRAIEATPEPFTGEAPDLDLPFIIGDAVVWLVGDADAATVLRAKGIIATHVPYR